MEMKIKWLAALTLCLSTCFISRASEYLFTTISLAEGLSQATSRAMLRDSHDYLWIGTKSGLNRFDHGHNVSYYNNPDNIHTIPDNDVYAIFEDAENRVWIICERGVAAYDRINDNFERIEFQGKPLRVRSYILLKDRILLGGGGQLYDYDYTTDKISQVATYGGSNRFYTDINPWGVDRYVLTTRWDGLWVYDATSGQINRFQPCSEREIMVSEVDDNGNLWVSPYGEGLRCYDHAGRCLYTAGADALGSDIILDVLNNGSDLWVATDGAGIQIIDTRTFEGRPFQNDHDNRQRSLRSVIKLYRDEFGYIYAGTVREGMTCISSSPMRTFSHAVAPEGMTVTSLSADGDDIWVGVDGAGIARYSPKDGDNFTKYPATDKMKVTSLEQYDDARLLVSTFDNGLFLFDKRTGTVSRAPALFNDIVAANAKKALPLDLRKIPGGKIAVLSDRLYLCDPSANQWAEMPSTRVSTRLNEFYTDYRSMLCFTEGEIVRYDIRSNRVETLAVIPERTIACAAFDGDRYIYIGTTAGVKRLDTTSGVIEPFGNVTAFTPRVTALVIDSGRLWIAAGGCVYIKNLDTGQFCRFDRYDGVTPNEFIYKSTLATPTQIYMGGVNGLLKVNRTEIPDYIAWKQNRPNVKITDVDADGRVLPGSKTDAVYEIPYGYSTVGLRVNGGDNHPMRQSPFRFYINSPEGDNPIETSDNTFTISRLNEGGRYEVYASAIAPDGSWSTPRRIVTLNVARPWWRSAWAIAAYILIFLLMIAAVFAYLIRRGRRKAAKQAEIIHRLSLEKEIGFLTNVNHELRTPLTLIYARLRALIEKQKNHSLSDPEIEEELDNIYQSTRRMRDIINTTVEQWAAQEGSEDAVEPTPPAPVAQPAVVQDSTPVDTSSMTVLIAEEDAELSAFIAENLKSEFGKVICSPDAKTAITEVKNINPDLIITDAHLPGMSGTELSQHIKQMEEYNHIPIIMLTTRLEDMSLRSGHDLGADIYITKPFDMQQLTNRCRMVLRSFHRIKQRYKGKASDILPRESYNNESETFLLKVKEVIEDNLSQPGFGVEIIVDKMLMSRSSLYSKFKELTGQSLGNYIDDYRLGRAKDMLVTSDMTMSEISDALGFSTQRYFSTFFKKKTGISPTQFRVENAQKAS